jgi:hypothetical protein
MESAHHTPGDEAGVAGKRRKFTGTYNPRHLRVLVALLLRPRSREELDRIAGCSNGPDLVSDLRKMGLELPCARTPCIDRDGFEVKRGIYSATEDDRRAVDAWKRQRDADRRRMRQGGLFGDGGEVKA